MHRLNVLRGRGRSFAPLWIAALAALVVQSCAQPAAPPPPPAAAPSPPPAPQAVGPATNLTNIRINGVLYPTMDAALAAWRDGEQRPLDGLTRDPDPIKGSALVILPDHDRLRPLVAQEQAIAFKRQVAGAALDFFIEERRASIRAGADTLVRSGTFEKISVVEQNDVANPDMGDADFLVWYQVRTLLPNNTGSWVGLWQVRHKGNLAASGAAVDAGTAPGTPRMASFAKSVREAALRLGGRSVSGVTSANLSNNGSSGIVTSGSGFVVDTEGHVLTNEHVIRTCTAPHITDTTNASYKAAIVATDIANDLALLKAEHHWPEAASFRDSGEPHPGDLVVVTGYPLPGLIGSGMTVTTGSVTALTGPRDDSRLLQLSAPVQPGNSGGPLLDANGHVAGVVTSTLNGMVLALAIGVMPQNVNFAVKTEIARNFLDTHEIGYSQAPATHELAAGDIGQRAKKFTVRITCGGP